MPKKKCRRLTGRPLLRAVAKSTRAVAGIVKRVERADEIDPFGLFVLEGYVKTLSALVKRVKAGAKKGG